MIEQLGDLLLQPDRGDRIYGVVVGAVTNNQDPDGPAGSRSGPWLSDGDESHWARLASPMAATSARAAYSPEVDDEVLVVFEQGQLDVPSSSAHSWNGEDDPRQGNDDGKNNLRMLAAQQSYR